MLDRPPLQTERLLLRPFRLSDAPRVRKLAGEYEIARSTLTIPHPYPAGAAEEWIGAHPEMVRTGTGYPWAVTLRQSGELIGATGLHGRRGDGEMELGYWIGKPYWGRGYATEAAGRVVRWGLLDVGLARVHARHFCRNPTSGAVMRKIGMRFVAHLPRQARKWGELLDVDVYEILARDLTREHETGSPDRPGTAAGNPHPTQI